MNKETMTLRKKERKVFEQLTESYRKNACAAEAASNLFPFEPIVMSTLIAQQKIINQLQKDLQVFNRSSSKCQLGVVCPNDQEKAC